MADSLWPRYTNDVTIFIGLANMERCRGWLLLSVVMHSVLDTLIEMPTSVVCCARQLRKTSLTA